MDRNISRVLHAAESNRQVSPGFLDAEVWGILRRWKFSGKGA